MAHNWKLANEGEFSNIKNNPFWQVKNFESTTARYIKFTAMKNANEKSAAGYSEFDIITK